MEEKKIDPSHWSLKLPINRQVDQNANPKYLLLWGAVAAQQAFQVSEDIYKNMPAFQLPSGILNSRVITLPDWSVEYLCRLLLVQTQTSCVRF